MGNDYGNVDVSSIQPESILEDCVAEQLTFVEGVLVAVENTTSGNNM